MAHDNEQEKDFIELDPEKINLETTGNAALPAESDYPSQTGRWSGKPPANDHSSGLPEVEPDNMPGDTEVQSKTIWHRY
jgi:hypothetical protein